MKLYIGLYDGSQYIKRFHEKRQGLTEKVKTLYVTKIKKLFCEK